MHTVGLLGINGRVGRAAADFLFPAALERKIKLVVLYRDHSRPKDIEPSENIELRVIDLEGEPAALEAVVKGINVFISALGGAALPSETKVVDALAKSADLVTYIPSVYSATWNAEDRARPGLADVLAFFHSGWDHAAKLGLGLTPIYVGSFEKEWFEQGLLKAAIKTNTVWANGNQLRNRFPITIIAHLGQGIADIAVRDPVTIKNKSYSVVSFWPTGQEFVDIYTKINGEPTTVKPYTERDEEELTADAANLGPAVAGYFRHWSNGDWAYDQEGRSYTASYEGPSLEEVARSFA